MATRKRRSKMKRKTWEAPAESSSRVLPRGDQSVSSCDLDWIKEVGDCPTYRPSMEEFQDPLLYLHKIAAEASHYGICKVVSPVDPSVPAGDVLMKEKRGFKFMTQLQPLRLPRWTKGDKATFYAGTRSLTVGDFEKMASKASAGRYSISACLPSSYLEKEFWKEMLQGSKATTTTAEYAINVEGTAFSSRSPTDLLARSNWNLKILPRLSRSALRLLEFPVPGVTDPMLYIGMLFSMFAWHVEDHYLYSINYHHCGAPKTWYGVPGSHALPFETTAQKHVYNQEILVNGTTGEEDGAFQLLLNKTTMFPPRILLQHKVPVFRAVQMPGEFVITFPRAYHAGFSHGFNCGEAVNFAMSDWFPFGAAAALRYARLGRSPIIPYEQLLCKEAMHLATSDCDVGPLKASFAWLLRVHRRALLCLRKPGGSSATMVAKKSSGGGSTFCILCKRECYLAHMECRCQAGQACLFHDMDDCRCGRKRKVFLREDISEMEDVARMFEQELADGDQRTNLHHVGIDDT